MTDEAESRRRLEAMELLGEQIAEHAAHLDAATHRLLCDIRVFDQEGGWAVQGARSCAQWLAWRLGWGTGTAREHVRVASKLGELPLIDDALRRGELSYCKVRAITRVALPANEEMLLMYAQHSTGAQLEAICRKYAAVLRHDDDTHPHEDVERRYVMRLDTADGMVKIIAVLHPEEAALVWAALDRTAAELCRDTPSDSHQAGASDVPAGSNAAGVSDTRHVPAEVNAVGVPGSRHVPAESNAVGAPDTRRVPAESNAAAGSGTTHIPADVNAVVPSTAHVPAESNAAGASDTRHVPTESNAVVASGTAHVLEESNAAGSNTTHSNRGGVVGSPAGSNVEGTSGRSAFSRADALVAIAEEIARGSRRERSPIEIAVSIPAETLKAGHLATGAVAPAAASHLEPGRNEIDPTAVACFSDGTCISAHAARRLACDCGVVDVVEDERGIALSIGRRRRSIPGAMKAALLRRDKTCQFPGCRTRVFLQGHHIEHWVDGGETKLGNMTCLCTHHHRYLHEYGFSITIARDGELEFRDALGKRVPQVPALPRPPRCGRETIVERNASLAISAETPACGWDGVPFDYALAIDGLVAIDGL
jgi:hypothetical protein